MKTLESLVIVLIIATSGAHNVSRQDSNQEIGTFNQTFLQLIARTDHAGMLELWAEDGVDLMPGDAPMVGKKKIAAWVEDIVAKMPGYKVMKQEMDFYDIRVCGDWASEWAREHQMVQPPNGKPPIESYGNMALVLHREANGEWKVEQEMWNAAPKP